MAADSGSNFSGQRARVMSPKVARGPSTGINAALRPPPLTRAQCPTVIPLAVGAGQRVVGRVHRARLSLVLELRVRRGEREGEVDGLLLVYRFVLYTIHELDLLLRVVQADLGRDLTRVQSGERVADRLAPRRRVHRGARRSAT